MIHVNRPFECSLHFRFSDHGLILYRQGEAKKPHLTRSMAQDDASAGTDRLFSKGPVSKSTTLQDLGLTPPSRWIMKILPAEPSRTASGKEKVHSVGDSSMKSEREASSEVIAREATSA